MPVAHSPHAPVSVTHPVPWKCCDRCGFRWTAPRTRFQMQWSGNSLVNTRLIVCPRCLDEPQQNGRRPFYIGPEPSPVRDPRPGYASTQMQGSVDMPSRDPIHDTFVPD